MAGSGSVLPRHAASIKKPVWGGKSNTVGMVSRGLETAE